MAGRPPRKRRRRSPRTNLIYSSDSQEEPEFEGFETDDFESSDEYTSLDIIQRLIRKRKRPNTSDASEDSLSRHVATDASAGEGTSGYEPNTVVHGGMLFCNRNNVSARTTRCI